MARQTINIGTVANDGTGDGIRTGGDKINDNFAELYDVLGWGYYQDAETSPATQTINTTPSKLQIDGASASSDSNYLPREIRGTAELWDTTNDKITPIKIGDGYDIRVSIEITGKTGSPNEITLQLDIGGGASPTIVISEISQSVAKTAPFILSFALPIFSLATFLSNGGQIFLSTDTGTVTVASRNILIKRDFKGDM